MDAIRISDLELECIVGVRPAERRRRQRVRLSVELELDLSRPGRTGRIAHTVDYSVVVDEIAFLLKFRGYRLIETATEEIAAMLLGAHASVERVHVTLAKLEALRRGSAHGAVSMSRAREATRATPSEFGEEVLLLETAEATLRLLHVEPGRRLGPLAGDSQHRLGWLVAGQLRSSESTIASHEPRELERILRADNLGPERVSVFLCTALR